MSRLHCAVYSVLHDKYIGTYIKYTSRVDKLLRILNDSKLVGCQKKFQDERVTYIYSLFRNKRFILYLIP